MSDQVSDVASTSNFDDGDESDNEFGQASSSSSSKQKTVHSIVEKKRRDKMTQYVTDLSNMIPMCGVMPRKLDKITVLRMAVQHLKAVKASKAAAGSAEPEKMPSIASETIISALLESNKCFLFVVACDRGKFLYVSESVSNFIECDHTELIGQSIFEMVHPKDVNKIKEQLIALDVTARETFIDAKTMEPVNPGIIPKDEINVTSSGAARSFFCRMKNKLQPSVVVKAEPDEVLKKKKPVHIYTNLQCTGFIKTWASSKLAAETNPQEQAEASSNLACLVAVARLTPRLTQHDLDKVGHLHMKPVQFYARLDYEYKFSFVEPLITFVTGFLPQEVLGSSVYSLFAEQDSTHLKELLRMTTKTNEKIVSPILNLLTVSTNSSICVRVVLSAFKNPFTNELEHTLLDITAVTSYTKSSGTTVVISDPTTASGNTLEEPSYAQTHTSGATTASLSDGYDADDDVNAETAKAIMMSALEADGGLGGQIDRHNIPWPFT